MLEQVLSRIAVSSVWFCRDLEFLSRSPSFAWMDEVQQSKFWKLSFTHSLRDKATFTGLDFVPTIVNYLPYINVQPLKYVYIHTHKNVHRKWISKCDLSDTAITVKIWSMGKQQTRGSHHEEFERSSSDLKRHFRKKSHSQSFGRCAKRGS